MMHHFPFELAERALTIRLEDAKASIEADRRHILNRIAGRSEMDLDAEPFDTHWNYDRVNNALRGRFAQVALRTAIEVNSYQVFLDALWTSGLRQLSLRLANCAVFVDET